jgi:Family of unknown function (DUF5719)
MNRWKMNNLRRLPLAVVLGAALVLTAIVSTFFTGSNPSQFATGTQEASYAESTGLHCSGLTSSAVTFFNTTSDSHKISVTWITSSGSSGSATSKLAAHAIWRVSEFGKGSVFAAEAQINGGGVVASVDGANGLQSSCSSVGTTSWYGAGFDTKVGSTGELSIYNPTATAAVFNVSTFTVKGFIAPASFQGLSVGAHKLLVLDLGSQLVNTSNIGVHVKVLRGSLEILGIQKSGNSVSYYPGQNQASQQNWFPLVTTENKAAAQLRFANPTANPISVTVKISLPPYSVEPQSVIVAPFNVDAITITPNTAIPASGFAFVSSSSSAPLLTTLALGTSKGIMLNAPATPLSSLLLANFNASPVSKVVITNVSKQSVTVNSSLLTGSKSASRGSKFSLKAGETVQVNLLNEQAGQIFSTEKNVLLVTAAFTTAPAGIALLSNLNSR